MPKKKKKSTRKKASVAATPQHSLPSGFWAQVGAVFLVVLSLLLVVAWFDVGGTRVILDQGGQYPAGNGRFCPPGQAKKGRC
jgi:hypothetical protein